MLATVDPGPYQQALDQAKSNLQSAEATLSDLQTPATELDIAQADQAVTKAQQDVEQAKQDLADLKAPDLTDLKNAVRNAQDGLQVALLQQTLTENGATCEERARLAVCGRLARAEAERVGAVGVCGHGEQGTDQTRLRPNRTR